MPSDWLNLTTHRLDIYDEKAAKVQFLDEFGNLFDADNAEEAALSSLPTAYDYIRLGHPLSCILEWTIARLNQLNPNAVVTFGSGTMPVLAILRKNHLINKKTQLVYQGDFNPFSETEIVQNVYGYTFELTRVDHMDDIPQFDGSTIFISQRDELFKAELSPKVDFFVHINSQLGSILIVNGEKNESYISEIQHVRRRETIAMTPANCLAVLRSFSENHPLPTKPLGVEAHKKSVIKTIKEVTGTNGKVIVGSSGLSVQYAIMMGLMDDAQSNHSGKPIKWIVPPNCYGGTNDQARRVAACFDHVEVVDLLVDGANDMVKSLDGILDSIAKEDAVPYIIAEIPTNPRVEVPDLTKLREVLAKQRATAQGNPAINPVFILDQTFCPNVIFLGEEGMLSSVRSIAYVSGSKFPSGGLCTAGYCVANTHAEPLMDKIALHMELCDNEATPLQYEILAKQLPSMNQRIQEAYQHTREFVSFIQKHLPSAKINFVSEELAQQGFTPSVFSLDLPTKGNTEEEREMYKRKLNDRLIHLMISEIPNESKYCVSYGQLKGCYWTIPATSTQGTTKEGDKDYIARVALSPKMDLEHHKQVFLKFVSEIQ